jgi:hypothetical protein
MGKGAGWWCQVKRLGRAIAFESLFLVFIVFFIHFPWDNPILGFFFFPSFVFIFIQLYEDMKAVGKQWKRKRNLEKYRI